MIAIVIVVFIMLPFGHDKELFSWDKELSLVPMTPCRSFCSFQDQEV